MPSFQARKKNYSHRVNYAHKALINNERSREFNNCFEMYDGEYVVAALMRRAKKDPVFKAAILKDFSTASDGAWERVPWHKTADKLSRLSDAQLATLAAHKTSEEEWRSAHIFLPQLDARKCSEAMPFEITRREGPDELVEEYYARSLREAVKAVESWTDRTVLGVPFLGLFAEIEVRSPEGDVHKV